MGQTAPAINMRETPLKIGIIGIGGFALAHHRVILELEQKGLLKLICTCDIYLDMMQETIKELKFEERGVRIFESYLEMIENFKNHLDLITIPSPIHLHGEMHSECVKRGLPVYLEKPPTLDYQELLKMIEIDSSAKKQTNVGFNFVVQKARQKIKERILSGEFGKIKKITFIGMWPRPASYFKRSPWAGRLILDNKLVLDSCFGNAISHYVHNILFWAGRNGIFSWDPVKTVEAELYKAHNIQGTDTVFVLASTENVPDIRIAMTHACIEKTPDIEKIHCEKATIYFEGNARTDEGTGINCQICWHDGKKEVIAEPNGNLLLENILHYANYVTGKEPRPLTKLLDTEPFVMLNSLLYIGARKIYEIPQNYKHVSYDANGETYIEIEKIRKVLEEFIETSSFPSMQKINWGKKGGKASREQVRNLNKIVRMMLK
ncbi:MAG: Gfo/Idh/MocA family oxidoreductase [bacterium]|nr:Gfo/Idh/MocA family oxidoreductase [bacterium]